VCVRVTAVFDQLVQLVDGTKLILVKCNIENTDVPFELYQVPTIKLYRPRDTKKYPIEYFDDPLQLSGYIQFLKEEGIFVIE
jgi:hypothetical protein